MSTCDPAVLDITGENNNLREKTLFLATYTLCRVIENLNGFCITWEILSQFIIKNSLQVSFDIIAISFQFCHSGIVHSFSLKENVINLGNIKSCSLLCLSICDFVDDSLKCNIAEQR